MFILIGLLYSNRIGIENTSVSLEIMCKSHLHSSSSLKKKWTTIIPSMSCDIRKLYYVYHILSKFSILAIKCVMYASVCIFCFSSNITNSLKWNVNFVKFIKKQIFEYHTLILLLNFNINTVYILFSWIQNLIIQYAYDLRKDTVVLRHFYVLLHIKRKLIKNTLIIR